MNNNQATHQVPIIRIGIVQSTNKVTLRCHSDFTACDVANNILLTGKSNERYALQIKSSQPAIISYQIRVVIYKDEAQAREQTVRFIKQGFDARTRIVGIQLQFHDRIIDNRDYWVTIGNFKSKEEATEFLQKNDLGMDAIVVEDVIEKATGIISLKDVELGDRIKIIPSDNNSLITVDGVPIGIEFHWQRQETLLYRGTMEIGFNNAGKLEIINELDIENYLASVNSSEMTPDCPRALLEAQTIAARSTVLATMGKHHYNTNYHLCSDDHCQCYHGVLREQAVSRQAMQNTFGEIMLYGSEVCDARYSKICGGIIESYENAWDERQVPYLVAAIDSDRPIEFPADTENKAKKLIDSSPPVFCNTNMHQLPEKLANLYSTQNLFRWRVEYERTDLENLIAQKLNIDLGELKDIIPLARGASGRLKLIQLVGSKKSITVRKELEIRRILSKSHLYSSCFYVEKQMLSNGKVKRFILKGAGWGHGVGLCQVGATVMAQMGFSYPAILKHYYKNVLLKKLY